MKQNESNTKKASAQYRIGTSGWQYDHWKGAFYPENIKKKEWFDYYTDHFDTVEINRSFYSLLSREALEDWKERCEKDFLFAIKGSRYITHMKKLKDPKDPLEKLFDSIHVLDNQLGPVLFQLPPHWKCNPDRLREFLESLPEKQRYAFEFRDPSWFCDEVYSLLHEHNCAFCIYQIAGEDSPREITADFAYIRLHGPSENAYEGEYGGSGLSGWVGAMRAWESKVDDFFVYFDNDQYGYAPKDALKLRDILEG